MAFLQIKIPWATLALVANTVQTICGFKAPTNQVLKVLEFRTSHDGALSSSQPDITELCRNTFAVNPPGSNSTSITPGKKDPGRAETVQTAAARSWTTEPTVITVEETVNVALYDGLYHYIYPFAAPEIIVGSQGYSVRQNSLAVVNSSGKFDVEE